MSDALNGHRKHTDKQSVQISDVSHTDVNIELDERVRPKSSEMSAAAASSSQKAAASEKKLGHRRVDHSGQVTYKKIKYSLERIMKTAEICIIHFMASYILNHAHGKIKSTTMLMYCIQHGVRHSISILASEPTRDLLVQDFNIVESLTFPHEGSGLTPAHHYSDFRFKAYAPIAFRYFRELFSIQPDDFLLSMCNDPLTELSNPGASGSIFYITEDDEFIIKTLQHKEAEFLQKLLPGYYMNLVQNTRTLLPKFYGLFCYQCGGKNIRFIVMNNLLPMSVHYHEKYDLKGSSYKRRASKREKSKKSPTLKDLDFLANHPDGISLEADTYNALITTIQRDCRVLQSFQIMDYSLLVGIHNLDLELREKAASSAESEANQASSSASTCDNNRALSRGKSLKQRVAQYSTAMESIQATTEPLVSDTESIPGGIPARNSKGERLFLYIGIIDVLQNYRIAKKMEHAFKSMLSDGDTISVHRPGFYAQRFQNFFSDKVFKKIPNPIKHSPSKRKGNSTNRARTLSEIEHTDIIANTIAEEPVPERPDLLTSAALNEAKHADKHSPKVTNKTPKDKYAKPDASMVINKLKPSDHQVVKDSTKIDEKSNEKDDSESAKKDIMV